MIGRIDIEKTLRNSPNNECLFVSVATILNRLVDAVNGILDYAPLEMAMKAEKPNIDIGELAYLQKENSDLKDELERTRKALEIIKKEFHKEIMPDFAVIRDALKGVSDE